jgi:hypothetical protein
MRCVQLQNDVDTLREMLRGGAGVLPKVVDDNRRTWVALDPPPACYESSLTSPYSSP